MSKSFYDDSWKEGYDLQTKSEIISEANWSEIGENNEYEDILIHIRRKPREQAPEPKPEIVQPEAYLPSRQFVPPLPPPPPGPILHPSFSQYQPYTQTPKVQSNGTILPTMPYGSQENQPVHNQGLYPYPYSLPASYLSQPLSPQSSLYYQPSLWRASYGTTYPYSALHGYSAADTFSAKGKNALTTSTPFYHRIPNDHHLPAPESTKALIRQFPHSAPSRSTG